MDIVERLREGRNNGTDLRWIVTEVHLEAAAEIERLRAELAGRDAIIRYLAALPPGGEVWERSKWLAELTERAKMIAAAKEEAGQ